MQLLSIALFGLVVFELLLMKWQGVKETSKEKIESLVNAFNTFILENHKGSEAEDERVRKEWQAFKQVIADNPANTDSHNKYVLALRNALLKEDVIKQQNGEKGAKYKEKQAKLKIVVDKTKLLALAKDLKRAVLRNTKIPLDLL